MNAGKLDKKLQFSKRQDVQDGYGNYQSGWLEQFSVAANIKYLRGNETVLASRLEATSPAIVTIRNSTQARDVTADWRAIDTRTDEVFQIKERPRESDDRSMLEMLVTSGVAG